MKPDLKPGDLLSYVRNNFDKSLNMVIEVRRTCEVESYVINSSWLRAGTIVVLAYAFDENYWRKIEL